MPPKKRRIYITVGCILAFLIIVRLLLPYIVLKYANKSLAGMSGYYGHVQDIDLHLYRGAYQLNRIYINKEDTLTGKQTEFFKAQKIDLSVEWHALFQGRLVGELEFFTPTLIFTKEKTELKQVARDTNDFRKILKDFMPLKINRFEVHNGSIHYVDETKTPKVDIFLKNTHILALNLKNTSKNKEELPSSVRAEAEAYEGSLKLSMSLNALAQQATFDLSASIKDANLTLLNNFFKAYGGFDVDRGTLGLYTEFAAEGGKFKGYVKPVIKNLKVLGPEDQKNNVLQQTKEAVINVAGKVLTNPKKKQLATKVPIEGDFGASRVGTWEAVWKVLKNAFIEALMPAVDQDIDIRSPETVGTKKQKGFFKRLFSKKEDKKKQPTAKKQPVGLEQYK